MIITKKSLGRRTFLRGVGASIALPFLDAMVPALNAAPAAKPPPRLGFFYVPNGIYPPSFHPAGDGGTQFTLSPVLKPLEPVRQHVTILSGLSNLTPGRGGGGHSSAHSGWLNGAPSKKTEGSDIRAGKTLDQYAADTLGANTIFRPPDLSPTSDDHANSVSTCVARVYAILSGGGFIFISGK